MDAREKTLLDAMFKKLERATNGFVQEGSVLFGTSRLSQKQQKPEIQRVPKWFSGFTSSPALYIRAKVKAQHPKASGRVIFFLAENYLWYGFYSKPEDCLPK